MIYKYAMFNRPAGLGTVPRDGFIGSEDRPTEGKPHHTYARNGVALFSRELTDAETKSFEMASMNDFDAEKAASAVAEMMHDHAREYLDSSLNDTSFFNGKVFEFHRKCAAGYPASIANYDDFRANVIQKLRALK